MSKLFGISPTTLRKIREDHFEVERDGKRIGSLTQNPRWTLTNAGRWVYWPDKQPPTPSFATFEDCRNAIQ